MVNPVWIIISLGLGLVAYFTPALVAQSLGPELRETIVRKYEWLAAMSYWRPTLVRRELGGYEMMTRAYDKEKKMDEVDEGLDMSDPDDRVNRWRSKPLAGMYAETPVAIDADLAEKGEHWHEHVKEGRHNPPNADVNLHTQVNDELQLCDFSNAYYLIPSDADPSDAGTVQSYVQRAMAGYRSNVSMTEALVGIVGLMGGLGGVVFLQKYILKATDSGGSGLNETVAPIGMVDISPLLDLGVALL